MLDSKILDVSRSIASAGGRAVLVGGWVRDRIMGQESKDYDVEVYGLGLEALEAVLEPLGEVVRVGRAFGVLRLKGLDCDFSLPRRDSKAGRGHCGFVVDLDPTLSFAEAARRRDLTINSMGFDPLSGEVLDPHSGRQDIERRVLKATDREHFPEDPLRGLRVAQFAARFEFEPDAELSELSSRLDLGELAPERVFEEFKKLLLKGRRPSLGLEFLRRTRLLRFFPELESMVGVPQDPEWHPEGTVWEHTLLVVDEAARAREGVEDDDLAVLFAALCHDLGKPSTTVIEDGRVRSPSHEVEGVPPAQRFLERLRAPKDLVERVLVLVRYHLAPAHFSSSETSDKAYHRLARRLGEGGASLKLLHRLAAADHFGRTTEDAVARRFPAGDEFLRRAEGLAVEEKAAPDVVLGRHLIARGMAPGPAFGPILLRCREVQDETGWDDPEKILARVLGGDGTEVAAAPPTSGA
jgi:tRNA nucleotidyltransferase (CCA-adding enzyme)